MASFAGYVWAAYGISLVSLAATAVVTVLGWKKASAQLKARAVQDSETNL